MGIFRSAILAICIGDFALATTSSMAEAPTAADDRSPAPSNTFRVLANEPSRGDLFQRIIAAENRAIPATELRAAPNWFNLYGPFAFPNDTVYDAVENRPRENAFFGIDISHYTASSIPIEELWSRNVKFVYVKASQGINIKDGKFATFWSRLGHLPAGREIHRGAYHFLAANGDTSQQARTFLTIIADNGRLQSTDMPPVLDLEWDAVTRDGPDRWQGQTPDQIIDKALTWLKLVEEGTGRRPVVYTNDVWWRERIVDEGKFAKFSHYLLWIADYSRSARAVEVPRMPDNSPYVLWQFTASARFASGFDAALDADVFKGSEGEFYEKFGIAKF